MKETIDLLGKIITNILTALYEPFGFSLLLSFLAMFFYLYAYESIHAGKGWKNAIVTWYQKFKESVLGMLRENRDPAALCRAAMTAAGSGTGRFCP